MFLLKSASSSSRSRTAFWVPPAILQLGLSANWAGGRADILPIPVKVNYDVEYAQRQSMGFDLIVLWLPVVKVLRSNGGVALMRAVYGCDSELRSTMISSQFLLAY